MIKKASLWLLSKVARKTHDIRIQLLVSTLYGSIVLYGVGGTITLVMKARKLSSNQTKKVVKRG